MTAPAVTPSHGGQASTTVGGTVETRQATGRQAKRGAIRSTLRYSFRRSEAWTELTLLKVRNLPRGATVHVTCRGARCPKGAAIVAKHNSVSLKRFTQRRFAVGTVITVRVSKPGRRARVTRIKVRQGEDPAAVASRLATSRDERDRPRSAAPRVPGPLP